MLVCTRKQGSGKASGRMYRMEKDQQGAPGARPRRNGQTDLLGANSEIGRKLRQYYDELISDEVPDRFTQLLRQLEEAASAQKKG
jgi:anti-sigma factor NepR-like protein